MSLRHAGVWHYQFVAGRPAGHRWRVADDDDDVVTDFATEGEARACVDEHNATAKPHSDRWPDA